MSNIKREDLAGYEQCFITIEDGVDHMSKQMSVCKSFDEVVSTLNAFMYFMHKTKLELLEAKRDSPPIILPFKLREVKNNE